MSNKVKDQNNTDFGYIADVYEPWDIAHIGESTPEYYAGMLEEIPVTAKAWGNTPKEANENYQKFRKKKRKQQDKKETLDMTNHVRSERDATAPYAAMLPAAAVAGPLVEATAAVAPMFAPGTAGGNFIGNAAKDMLAYELGNRAFKTVTGTTPGELIRHYADYLSDGAIPEYFHNQVGGDVAYDLLTETPMFGLSAKAAPLVEQAVTLPFKKGIGAYQAYKGFQNGLKKGVAEAVSEVGLNTNTMTNTLLADVVSDIVRTIKTNERLGHPNYNAEDLIEKARERYILNIKSAHQRANWKKAYPGKPESWYDAQIEARIKLVNEAFDNIELKDIIDNDPTLNGISKAHGNGRSVLTKEEDMTLREKLAANNGKVVYRVNDVYTPEGIEIRNDLSDVKMQLTPTHEALHQSTLNIQGDPNGGGSIFIIDDAPNMTTFTYRPQTVGNVVDRNALLQMANPIHDDILAYTMANLLNYPPLERMLRLAAAYELKFGRLPKGLELDQYIKNFLYHNDGLFNVRGSTETQSRSGVAYIYDLEGVDKNNITDIIKRLEDIQNGTIDGSSNVKDLLRYRSPRELGPIIQNVLLSGAALTTIGNFINTLKKHGGTLNYLNYIK